MTPETATAPPRSTLHLVFFNQRGLKAGWRLLIFAAGLFVLTLGLMPLFRGLVALAKHAVAAEWAPGVAQLIFEVLAFGAVLLMSWLMSRIERRSVGEYGLPVSRPAGSLRRLATGIAIGFFEESLFRGYALYTLADGITFWPAVVIMGLIFSGAHLGNSGESYVGAAGIMFWALLNSAVLRRTGDLWVAVGIHAGFDWAESFFFGVSDSGTQGPGNLLNPHI